MDTEILDWDPTTGGRWRYVARRYGVEYAFHGCSHEVGDDHMVQSFMFDGQPHDVALETLRFEGRGQWLASGMETGVDEGYGKLDVVVAELR